MQLNLTNHKLSVIERGVYYFPLPNYPQISALELKNILAFIEYEKSYGRQTEIICDNEVLLNTVNNAIANPITVVNTLLPEKITGCLTEFVYHATTLKSAQQILKSGKLLSAVKVCGKTGDELAFEKRDSPWNDPADFFEYIMFCWGNCFVGDYVVMSELPDTESFEELFQRGFNTGVRFYFRYKDIIRHPGLVFDGYHPVKVKDEIVLSEYLHACIVPEQYKTELENLVLPELFARVYYLPQNGLGICDWSEKVYEFVSNL